MAASILPLTDEQLSLIQTTLETRIRTGLSEDGAEIKALPAYLGPPSTALTGRAAVVDIGGTHIRAAVVELGQEAKVVSEIVERDLDAGYGLGSAVEFFDAQADMLAEVGAKGMPVGYCFSYPSTSTPELDARLIRWTKEIAVPGVEGELVGTGLREAMLRRQLDPGPVAVVNDTVATLLAGCALHKGDDCSRTIGLIVGTGMNVATFFGASDCPKLAGHDLPPRVAINLESGNYWPPHLTAVDDAFDRGSDAPQTQRIEKAVSGGYLGGLMDAWYPDAGFDASTGSRGVVALRDGVAGTALMREAAQILLARSADLTAAVLAGLLSFHGEGEPVSIFAEGSLFWGDLQYRDRVAGTLSKLCGDAQPWQIAERAEDANLVGAACAAMIC